MGDLDVFLLILFLFRNMVDLFIFLLFLDVYRSSYREPTDIIPFNALPNIRFNARVFCFFFRFDIGDVEQVIPPIMIF